MLNICLKYSPNFKQWSIGPPDNVRYFSKYVLVLSDPSDLETKTFLFPARLGDTRERHLTRGAADKALRKVCAALNIGGASTHSWRRTSLTNANDAGISLRVLQSLSGHSSLDMLSRYLQTSDTQKRQAADAFG